MKPLFFTICSFFAATSFAQNIHYTQFDATPLAVNPAFTGMFDGSTRVSALYRNQWASVTVPYITYGATADLPVFTDKKGNYLATGIQLLKDQAGDGNITNFNGIASVAYHKLFRKKNDSNNYHSSTLSFGVQAAYNQSSVESYNLTTTNLSDLYFGNQFVNEYIIILPWGYNYMISYASVNAGICFSHSAGPHFSYTIGLAGYNLNRPTKTLEQTQNQRSVYDKCYIGEAGADWIVTKRLSLRPQVLIQSLPNTTDIIAGNEFCYNVSRKSSHKATSVFLGGWYRSGDVTMVTAGVELKSFRIGISYDYYVSTLNTASNGNGGFEIAARYIAHGRSAHKRDVPGGVF